MIVEVCNMGRDKEHVRLVSLNTLKVNDQIPMTISCLECLGTGWWDFADYAVEEGICIECKGTGKRWLS